MTNPNTDPTALKATVLDVLAGIAPEIDPASIDATAPLREDLDLDSLDFQRLIAGIHERTGVDIPDHDLQQLSSLDDLVGYLASR